MRAVSSRSSTSARCGAVRRATPTRSNCCAPASATPARPPRASSPTIDRSRGDSAPLPAQRLALDGEPVQRDQRESVLDLSGIEHGERFFGALDDDPNIFAFVGEAVDAAGIAGIDAATEEIN